MPRVFTEEDIEGHDDEDFDEDGPDPWLVPPEAYHYLPPPAFGGGIPPVHVAVDPGAPPPRPRRGLLSLLFGAPTPRTRDEWEARIDAAAAMLAQRMAALGAVKVYCRYDGGNDEGFAWFDHAVFADGSTRDAEQLARDLKASGAADAITRALGRSFDMKNALHDLIAATWGSKLLGRGYGTGPFSMYGAFWADLRTGLLSDDPNPAPVVQNIKFGEKE